MMNIYEATRQPPREALKTIQGGRLKGFTDINPMWRIKALTEQFGPCGIGWKYEITRQWLEESTAGVADTIAAFVNINLYFKYEGEWSEAIPGTGGSMLMEVQRGKPYVSDEAYKMALTDAISVACKALGFGADVYWQDDRTKYDTPAEKKEPVKTSSKTIHKTQVMELFNLAEGDRELLQDMLDTHGYKASTDIEISKFPMIKDYIKQMVDLKNES